MLDSRWLWIQTCLQRKPPTIAAISELTQALVRPESASDMILRRKRVQTHISKLDNLVC